MHQQNSSSPKPAVQSPHASSAGRAYLGLLAAGWVFVVGMAVAGPWAVGTQVESRLVVVPSAAGDSSAAAQKLKRQLERALRGALGAESVPTPPGQQEPKHRQLDWQRLSLAQRQELVRQLGLSVPPSRFRAFWGGEKKRPQLVVQVVLPEPAAAPARLQHLLHRIGQQAVASYKQELFQQLAAARAEARQHWQALIQTDHRLQQWLLEVLGPQASVTPVAYWERLPEPAQGPDGAPVLPAAAPEPQSAPPPEQATPAPPASWAELTIQQLRQRVAQLEAQDEELAARLTPQHPQRQQLQETLRRLRIYLARRLKQAGEQLPAAPASSKQPPSPSHDQAREQLAQRLQQHARTLQRFRQELDRLSRAYLETAQREARLWQQYQQLERKPPVHVIPVHLRSVWLPSRRNQLAWALALAGLVVAGAVVRWHRWSQDSFTGAEQMSRELGQEVVAVAPWWYEASRPVRKRWRQRLQRLQRLLEWSLLGAAAVWAALGVLQAEFRSQWAQDPLLAIACTWRYLTGG